MTNVSFLIPSHNSSAFISRTLDTVFAASLPGDEIIVIDGSSDDTFLLLQKYQAKNQKRLILIKSKPEDEVIDRICDGINCSTNQYLFICDSDDQINTQEFASARKSMDENPGFDVYFINANEISLGKQRPLIFFPNAKAGPIDRDKVLQTVFSDPSKGPWWLKIFNKAQFPTNKYKAASKQAFNASDFFFSLLLVSFSSNFYYLDQIVYKYIHRENSFWKSLSPTKINGYLFAVDAAVSMAELLERPDLIELVFKDIAPSEYRAAIIESFACARKYGEFLKLRKKILNSRNYRKFVKSKKGKPYSKKYKLVLFCFSAGIFFPVNLFAKKLFKSWAKG